MWSGNYGAVGATAGGARVWAWMSVGLGLGPGRPCTFGNLPTAFVLIAAAPELYLLHTYKRKRVRGKK